MPFCAVTIWVDVLAELLGGPISSSASTITAIATALSTTSGQTLRLTLVTPHHPAPGHPRRGNASERERPAAAKLSYGRGARRDGGGCSKNRRPPPRVQRCAH